VAARCLTNKIRNPNIEIRNNIEIRMKKNEPVFHSISAWFWYFEFRVCFEFRYSNFGFPRMRAVWTNLSDAQLLSQCEVDTYRASGPGGQKRNKTSSAVRLRHPASGLIVIAEESRSQHENRARALKRLRQGLYLKVRDELPPAGLSADVSRQASDFLGKNGRLDLGRNDPRFWPALGLILDLLLTFEGRISDVAHAMAVSTANLVDFLRTEPKAWAEANNVRARFGQKNLR
jgi:hypothetical protein